MYMYIYIPMGKMCSVKEKHITNRSIYVVYIHYISFWNGKLTRKQGHEVKIFVILILCTC